MFTSNLVFITRLLITNVDVPYVPWNTVDFFNDSFKQIELIELIRQISTETLIVT